MYEADFKSQRKGFLMKKFIFSATALCFFLLTHIASAEPLKVIASIFPLADMAKQVGGDRVQVKTMLPSGASPHTFEPTPLEMTELHKAKVLIKAGAGLEFWLEKMLASAENRKIIIVDSSSGITLIKEIHSHSQKIKIGNALDEPADPHVWLDPIFAKMIVDKIADAFLKADPDGKTYYLQRAKEYKKELDTLHKEISAEVEKFKIKEYVTFHSAWGYFSKRYGLKIAGVIEESPGRDPGPKHIAKIVELIKKLNTRVVFAEPQFNPAMAQVIAKEAGAKVAFLDPIGAPGIKGKDTYLGLMRYNLSVMAEAMK